MAILDMFRSMDNSMHSVSLYASLLYRCSNRCYDPGKFHGRGVCLCVCAHACVCGCVQVCACSAMKFLYTYAIQLYKHSTQTLYLPVPNIAESLKMAYEYSEGSTQCKVNEQ